MTYSCVVFFALICAVHIQGYTVPRATIEAIKPYGLRISIPDVPGIQLVGVHANINASIRKRVPGRLSQDTLRAKNGRWTIEDPQIRTKVGDTVYYWIYVQANGKSYYTEPMSHRIKELIDRKNIPSPPVTSCTKTATTMNGNSSCQGKLLFEDNFSSLDRRKWKNVVKFAEGPGYEFVVYSGSKQNSFVSDGKLHVKPTLLSDSNIDIRTASLDLSGCTEAEGSSLCSRHARAWYILPPVQSAQLTTKDSFSFRYGKIEIRAKLPAGDWLFPEIRLEPKPDLHGRKPPKHIEMALVRGNQNLKAEKYEIGSRYFQMQCIQKEKGSEGSTMLSTFGSSPWSDDFHVYTLTWTPDELIFKLDDQGIGSTTSCLSTFQWQGTRRNDMTPEFFLTIGLGVGGLENFPDKSVSLNYQKPWRNTSPKAMLMFWNDKDRWFPTWNGDDAALQIDYIKVWAL